jgi:hypothetical protein
MKYVLISLSFVCWLLISLTIIGIIITPFSYFSGESDLSEIISVLIMGPLSIAFFYWLGPNRYKKYKLKKIEELAGRQGVEISPKPTLFQRFTRFAPGYNQEEVDKSLADAKKVLKNSKAEIKQGWKNFKAETKAEIKEIEEQHEKEKKSKEKIKWIGPIAMWKGFKAEMKKLEEQQEKEKKLKQEKYIWEQKTLLENSYINNEHKIICKTINTLDNYFFRAPPEGGCLEADNYSNDCIEWLLLEGKEWLELKNSPSKVPDDEIWKSCFIRNEVCIGMPIEYVEKLLVTFEYRIPDIDSKKIENSKGTTLIRRYGKYKNKVGSHSYKYEVKYRDNIVISYKEL